MWKNPQRENERMTRQITVLFALLFAGCGGASAAAGASVNSDGTVSADAEVDTPGGSLSASADSSGGASATASGGGYSATTVSGGAVDSTSYAQPVQGYATTGGCTEQWVHMPMIINFPSGGSIIDAQNRAVLQEMVRGAQGRPDIVAVRVEGHTDHCGREVNNIALSQQRAEAVAMELVSMGVPRERVQMVGYGSSMPRANEDCNRQGREELSRNMNRRVEFSLLVCR